MKQSISLLFAFLAISVVMAQKNINVKELIPDFNGSKSISEIPLLEPYVLEDIYSVNEIYVQDSVYYYSGSSDEWDLFFRAKNMGRNALGNVTSVTQDYYDSGSSGWIKMLKGEISYMDDGFSRKTYVQYPWNRLLESWADTSYFEHNDDAGNLMVLFSKNWSDYSNNFSFGSKSIYTRNENGQLTERIDQDWDSETQKWVNGTRIKQFYDNEGGLVQATIETWNSGSSVWVNSSNQTYSWEGNVRTVTVQNWNTNTETWENDMRLVYHFEDLAGGSIATKSFSSSTPMLNPTTTNSMGLLLVLFEILSFDGEQWVYYFRTSYSFNSALQLLYQLSQLFMVSESNSSAYVAQNQLPYVKSVTEGSWVNSDKTSYSYDANGNVIQEKDQEWDSEAGQWQDLSQCDYVFNSNNEETESFCKSWDTELSQWMNSSRSFDFFEETIGYRTWEYSQWWSTYDNAWQNSSRTDYFWQAFVPVSSVLEELNTISVYPNPTRGKIRVETKTGMLTGIAKVYAQNGVLLKTEVLDATKEIDFSDYANGLYLLTITNEKGIWREKIVKE